MNSRFMLMAIIVFMLTLIGCKANKEPLDLFYIEAKQKGDYEIENLPQAGSFNVESYTKSKFRSPFLLPNQTDVTPKKLRKKDCWQPIVRKEKEPLERYLLNQLRLKGIMGFESDVIALIQTPNGNVVNVRKGQYIGQNDGKITSVQSKKIIIKETLRDGFGCWKKRKIALVLK